MHNVSDTKVEGFIIANSFPLLLPVPTQLLSGYDTRWWKKEFKFITRCLQEKMSVCIEFQSSGLTGYKCLRCGYWKRGLGVGRDYVFHYPNISNFSLQFGEAK